MADQVVHAVIARLRSTFLSVRASARYARFERTGAVADLDGVIETFRAGVAATPAGHPDRAMWLSNLGNVLRLRFERTGQQADLDAAIETGQAAVAVDPAGHPYRATCLSNLGIALQARFNRTGTVADLDAAIEICQAAVAATPHDDPNRAILLSNLGNALRLRFEQTGDRADLDAAIKTGQAAVAATPGDHPNRPMLLSNLGIALQARFSRTGVAADLDAAIGNLRAAVAVAPADPPSRAMCLSNLASAFQAKFERTGAQADLNAAIDNLQTAVAAIPADHPGRPGYLSNLGIVRLVRFERTGEQADLDAAIETGQAAVAAIPPSQPDRVVRLSHLGGALLLRFERTGALADLDAAIDNLQTALEATPADHPGRPIWLSNLGTALRARFARTGALADLDAAIEVGQSAIAATFTDHRYQMLCLSNLGVAQLTRFGRTGTAADLDAAIENLGAAVAGTPVGHLYRAKWLSNLGIGLRMRFERAGALADLDAAIDNLGTAVAVTPTDRPDRAHYLSNLGSALLARFERTGEPTDLDAAIDNLQTAADATPADHPNRAQYLFNLANALCARFERAGAQTDHAAALSACTQAAELGSAAPSIRIPAARTGASLAARSKPGRAADLLEIGVRLLPELAPRQLVRADQQYALGGFSGLASDAAALVLMDTDTGSRSENRAERALALLEAGRAVLLSQALDTRSDLTDLRSQHPGLAARLAELRERLDQPPDDTAPVSVLTGETDIEDRSGQTAGDRRRLAGQLAAVLEEIRALDGFSSFGHPPTASDLLSDAGPGPVVTFSISAYRSDALLLTENRIASLHLPSLVFDTVRAQISSFHDALRAAADLSLTAQERRAAQARLSRILEWLWDSAAEPVLHALGYDRQPPPGSAWPRVWWAPGGLLNLLPIHAAGYHDTPACDNGRRTVMDRVISSYTPTVRALRYARQHIPAAATANRSLIVAMPVTPGLPGHGELPNVPAEVGRVRALLPDPLILIEPSAPEDLVWDSSGVPTRASVFAQLPGCSIAHFACHGASDPSDPSRSLLLLHDHDRDPLTVASLAAVDLAYAQLAYLSACRTAFTSATGLLDEAIHLVTAFQLAGFPHVIGTLWEISDQLAVDVAESVYVALRDSEGILEVSQAARALHRAMRDLRDQYPKSPALWAAYLHAGA